MDAVGQLAAGVAHDFNNLLTIINGYSEILLSTPPADEALHYNLEQIRNAGEQAASLTRQLLTFSRQTMLEMKVLNLNAVVTEAENMLRRLFEDGIQLIVRRCLDLDSIKSDSGQLHQVVLNLAFNARDAMPDGGRLTIETPNVELDEAYCNLPPEMKPGKFVMLAVSTPAIGMTRKSSLTCRPVLHDERGRKRDWTRSAGGPRDRPAERWPHQSPQRTGARNDIQALFPGRQRRPLN